MPVKLNKLHIIVLTIGILLIVGMHLLNKHSDRPFFYFAVFFGIMLIAIVVGTNVFNRKVSGSSQPKPWMRNVRRFQDEQLNAGWRIQMIPYDDSSKPMMMNVSGFVAYVPVVGALAFVTGFGMVGYDKEKYGKPAFALLIGGFLVMLCGVWLKARIKRTGWDVAFGRCVDRELKKVLVSTEHGSSWGWYWRIVCEYEYLGIKYRVTPEVYWANFTSEEAAQKFIKERISPAGECMLRVSPKNPLQTELFDQGIKDKLLY